MSRIDRLVEAQTLAVELRRGSCRSGAALLAVHEKLGTPGQGIIVGLFVPARRQGMPPRFRDLSGAASRWIWRQRRFCRPIPWPWAW